MLIVVAGLVLFLITLEGRRTYTMDNGYPSTSKDVVGFWKFNEGKGDIVKDSSKCKNNGKLVGQLAWVDGKFGKALSFNGASSYIEVPDSPSLNPEFLTIDVWIYPKSLGDRGIVRKDWAYALAIYKDKLQFAPGQDWQFYSSGYSPPINKWTHITVTYDGKTIKFYADKKLVGTANPPPGKLPSSKNPCWIGYDDNGWYFDGFIDNVYIYNKVRPPSRF